MSRKQKILYSLIGILLMIFAVMPITSKAVVSKMPEAINGVITLTEDVTLTEKYVVSEGTTLKIDLNGYTLTGPSGNYVIDNRGNLTIVDNGATKGKIVGIAPSASCIRNGNDAGTLNSSLTINGVTIESAFVVVKTEPEAITNINYSTLTSTYTKVDTGTILNWGKTTVTNSTVTASTKGVAIFAISGHNAAKNSEINITNTDLSGLYSVMAKRHSTSDSTSQAVNISGGSLKGNMLGNSTKGTDWSFAGNIEYKSDNNYLNSIVMPNAKENTKITITSATFKKPLNIPDTVKVVVSENTELTVNYNGVSANNITIKGTVVNRNVLSSNDNTYYPTLESAISKVHLGDENEQDAGNYTKYTMTLLNDTQETSAISVNRSNISIDLNGNMLSLNRGLSVNTIGYVTIDDTSEARKGKVNGTITNKGKLTIENGNYAIAPVTEKGATTTLNGGTYPIEDIEKVTISEDREWVKNTDGTYSIVYKKADYSKVDELIKKVEGLNKDNYKDFSAVEAAVNAVVRDKNITEQTEVDNYVAAIQKAIDELEIKQEQVENKDNSENDVGDNNEGDEDSDTTNTPATGDNILIWVSLLLASTIGLIVTVKKSKKQNK